MTSKEALDKLWKAATNPEEFLLDDEPANIELRETVEKDLEALDTLKKYTVIEPHVEVINGCTCPKEDYQIVKEWLEKGARDDAE